MCQNYLLFIRHETRLPFFGTNLPVLFNHSILHLLNILKVKFNNDGD